MNAPSRFKPIGDLVQDEVDPAVEVDAHRSNRIRFIEAAEQRARRSSRRSAWLVLPAAVAMAALLALTLGPWRSSGEPELIRFTVGVDKKQGQVGRYIAPVAMRPMPVHFSDGSWLEVHPRSRARVAETTTRGASVALESGRIDLFVEHQQGSSWMVVAGPYQVLVTGTEFGVSWRPEEGHAEVRVEEGVVVVTGPSVEGGVEVRAGETFSSRNSVSVEPSPEDSALSGPPPVTMREANDGAETSGEVDTPLHPEPAEDRAEDAGAVVEEAVVEEIEAALDAGAEAGVSDAGASITEPTWGELAAKGKYDEIVRLAEARGVESILASGSAAELQALSQAARFTGRGALGRRCLMQLRARHPGSGQARAAAFVLGKMADQGGQSPAALQWYDTYLTESPGGALAAEAYGRRMVLLRGLGRTSEAEAAARQYLKSFPKGGYAPVARDVLGL